MLWLAAEFRSWRRLVASLTRKCRALVVLRRKNERRRSPNTAGGITVPTCVVCRALSNTRRSQVKRDHVQICQGPEDRRISACFSEFPAELADRARGTAYIFRSLDSLGRTRRTLYAHGRPSAASRRRQVTGWSRPGSSNCSSSIGTTVAGWIRRDHTIERSRSTTRRDRDSIAISSMALIVAAPRAVLSKMHQTGVRRNDCIRALS